jgi:hypothetical protein
MLGPPPKPPATLSARLTDAAAQRLTFYAFDGTFILAPRGWRCDGGSGSGGARLKAHNPQAGFHPATSGGYEPEEAVSAYVSEGSNHTLELACPWFLDAAGMLQQQGIGLGCDTVDPTPIGEQQTHTNYNELRFTDPPRVGGTGDPSGGRNPATGIVLWLPGRDAKDNINAAATATCVLPPSDQSVCSLILGEFRARFHSTFSSVR